MFLKDDIQKTLKVRMLAGGNKQCITIDTEDSASPTAALESVLLTFKTDS